jgi:NADPH:quinone reductase-like Zn-dependent oxidoreductase
VGKSVKRLKKGDQVYGFSSRLGTHAEYACLLEEGAALKPTNMSYEEAAAVVQGALTALYFLRKGEIESGHKILIYGASGGVGSHAVQLAKHFGAEVTGVCSSSKMEFVKSLGADKVIDYKKEDFTKNGETYDAIFDTVGKTPVSSSIKALKEDGRYILATFGLTMLIKTLWLLRKSSKKAVFGLVEENSEELDFLRNLIEREELKAAVDRGYPMEEAAEAHSFVESGQKKGSVVFTIRQTEKS